MSQPRILELDVFPPETEIRVFLPGSPPEGDLLPNGTETSIPGNVLNFTARLRAEGFEARDLDIKMLEINATRPGYWKYEAALRPESLKAVARTYWHRAPLLVGGGLGAVFLVILGSLGYLRRRTTQAERSILEARKAAQSEVRAALETADPALLNLEGTEIDGYAVKERIGKGAYSTVYRARHHELGEEVALKILQQDAVNKEILARMKREIAIGSQLKHPNIVKIYAFGIFRGAPYTVAEFVPGLPLNEVMESRSLELDEVARMMTQVLAGLSYAHSKKVVHRDLKPANLFLTDTKVVKILDFGLASLLEAENKITKTGQSLGTPLYMSPEQIRAKSGFASDYYSFGVILFEMVTGETPFWSEQTMEVLSAHAFKKPPLAHEANKDVPLELSELIDRLLEKNPKTRLTNPEVIESTLAKFL
jgi:tRNA A-37 threonylcarbamoyl transferase component Bud32